MLKLPEIEELDRAIAAVDIYPEPETRRAVFCTFSNCADLARPKCSVCLFNVTNGDQTAANDQFIKWEKTL